MKNFLSIGICFALSMVSASAVEATVCSSDSSPASTLVFPFVVLDYSGTKSTVIGITNTSPEAQIVHITVWTDYGVAILDFNIVLSGYDLQPLNIRDLLVDGTLPVSGDPEASGDPGGVIARGPVLPTSSLPVPSSSASIFDRCNSGSHVSVPSAYTDPIGASILDLFESFLQMSQTQDRLHEACGGAAYYLGDQFETRDTADPTMMWITADVVWTCNKLLPDRDLEYWHDGPVENPSYSESGAQRFVANVLIGEMTSFDIDSGDSYTARAIHLEADRSLGDNTINSPILHPWTGMPQSFYHAHSSSSGSSDLREPLPTAWAFRYFDYDDLADTWIRVFKAPLTNPDLDFPGLNGGTMYADDCFAYTYYAWDNDGTVVSGGPSVDENLLPLSTQEVRADNFTVPGGFGWLLFQWPHTNAELGELFQTWVEVRDDWDDYGSNVRPAAPMANFNCDHGAIMSSSLELGNTSGWSATKP